MSIRQTIMILGFFLIIQPFLGFNSSIDTILNVVVGLLIIILAYKIFPIQSGATNSDKDVVSGNDYKNSTKKEDLPFVEHKTDINNNPVS